MSLTRSLLLAASQNVWLSERARRYKFVRHTVSRFMPGETLEEALDAAVKLREQQIGSIFTHLGENVRNRSEAEQVVEHYMGALHNIQERGLIPEISLKLTQLGLDISPELCYENIAKILRHRQAKATAWIDMESSPYVDATLELYQRVLRNFPDVGLCLQAYLYRTETDFQKLLPFAPTIRLVKGAYNETSQVAYPRKKEIDENYFSLARALLRAKVAGRCARVAFGTHDLALIQRISAFMEQENISGKELEVQMLYGIQRVEQERLAKAGCRSIVLIVYGTYWYAWFIRRLAERPANLWFLLRNIFAI